MAGFFVAYLLRVTSKVRALLQAGGGLLHGLRKLFSGQAGPGTSIWVWMTLGLIMAGSVLAAGSVAELSPSANTANVAVPHAEARLLVDKMSRAQREQDYSGVFTYEYGAQLATLRIFHTVNDGVENERLIHLDGEHREILRQGHEVSCVHAGGPQGPA